MQICHVLNKEYHPERFDTVAVTLLWLLSITVRVTTGNPHHYIAWISAVVCVCDCFKFCYVLARRMADLLNIKVFGFTEKAKIK